MNVVEVILLRDCLDGSMFKDIVVDLPVSRFFIRSLSQLGTLEYFAHLPRPFYRVTRSGEFVLKGIQGCNRFQAMFVRNADGWEQTLRQHIERLPNVPDALPSATAAAVPPREPAAPEACRCAPALRTGAARGESPVETCA